MYKFYHPFNDDDLLNTCCGPGIGKAAVNKLKKTPVLKVLHLMWKGELANKHKEKHKIILESKCSQEIYGVNELECDGAWEKVL